MRFNISDQSDFSLYSILNLTEASEVINLSQINLFPSVKLWSKRDGVDEVLSDLSDSDTDKSSISKSSDSVSIMTSSDTDGSVKSIEELDIDRDGRSIEDSLLTQTNASFFGDDLLDFEKRISFIGKLAEDFRSTYKYTISQGRFKLESILRSTLDLIYKIHKELCLFYYLDCLSRKIEKMNTLSLENLINILKELYSDMVSFHTQMCRLLSTDLSSNVSSILLELAPYLLDSLFCTMNILLNHLKENISHEDLIDIFQKVLSQCILVCCSYLDHSDELLRRVSFLAIYRLTLIFLPLDLIYTLKSDYEGPTETNLNFRSRVVEKLTVEYLEDDFKASTLLVNNYNPTLRPKNIHDSESDMFNIGAGSLEMCLRSGITRRNYPTSHVDPIGCFELMSKYSVSDVWKRYESWLIQGLETLDPMVRRISLLIIRHLLCTLKLTERDLHYVVSCVQNCLSDNDILGECLSVMSTQSVLYPLKDGAVKKIVKHTVMSSRRETKIKVLEFFSECRFTQNGLTYLISIFKSLSQSFDSYLYYNDSDQDDLNNMDTFPLKVWSKIVDSLVSLCNSHKHLGNLEVMSEVFGNFLGRRNISVLPGSAWIPMIWKYVDQNTDEKSSIMKCLLYPEASIRFPKIVFPLSEYEKATVMEYSQVNEAFLSLGITGDITEKFLNDNKNWKMIHDLRIPWSLYHKEKMLDLFRDDYTTLDDHSEEPAVSDEKNLENSCDCIDCQIDIMVPNYDAKSFNQPGTDLSKDPLTDVTRESRCNRFNRSKESVRKAILTSSVSNSEWSFRDKYSLGLANFRTSSSEDVKTCNFIVDDIDCYTFPSSLGCHLSLEFVMKPEDSPPNVKITYKLPSIVNYSWKSDNKENGWVDVENNVPESRVKGPKMNTKYVDEVKLVSGKQNGLYYGIAEFKINIPFATTTPVPLKLNYKLDGSEGPLGVVWVHPK